MIELYTWKTPNGRKVSIALEELGLDYRVHAIDLATGSQKRPDYLRINPNGKIPAIVDGKTTVFESGAILVYLAEKTGQLLAPPAEAQSRASALGWLMFQMSAVGPILGQLSHFTKHAPEKVPYAIKRFADESERILSVIEARLVGHEFLTDAFSIADIATYPWIAAATAHMSFDGRPGTTAWLERVGARPAVKRGMQVP